MKTLRLVLAALVAFGIVLTAFSYTSAATILFPTGGGTGWGSLQSNTILLGNGTGRISTTTQGTNGYVLSLVNGVPTWQATTTLANISGVLTVPSGGTGASTLTGLIKGNGTSAFTVGVNGTDYTLITANTCSAGNHVSAITAAGVITCSADSGGSGGSGNVATSTSETAGNLAYWTSTGATPATLGKVGTTTATLGSEFAYSGTLGKLVGGADGTLTLSTNGTALTKLAQIAANTVLGNNTGSTGNVVAFATSTLFGTGTGGQVLAWSGGVPTWVATTTAGTGLTYSGGAFNVNSTQSISKLSNLTSNGFVKTSGGDGTLSIDTNTYLTAAVQSLVLPQGSFTGNLTIATTSNTTNGITSTLTAVGSGSTITLSSNQSGTLTVAGGGTGVGTFTSSQLLYGNGTNALSSVATSSASCSSGVSCSSFTVVGGVSPSITNTGVLSIAQTGGGTAQTGAITLATSSATSNGITSGIKITNSSGAFTFTPTLSGTLTVAGGGTGLTTFGGAGTVLYTTAADTLASDAGLIYNGTNDLLTISSAGTGGTNGIMLSNSDATQYANLGFNANNSQVADLGSSFVNGALVGPAFGHFTNAANGFVFAAYNATGYIDFVSGGLATSNRRMRITAAGLVGVGTTTPWGLLSVNANGLGAGVPQFVIGSSSATNFIVANNGSVGVATTSPYAKLSVGGDVVVGASTAGGTLGDLYLPKLGTAAGAFLAVDSVGKVIATTSPSGGAKLDYQSFTSSGTWTKPSGTTGNEEVLVQVWGAGGAGGGSTYGGGGGGGAMCELRILASRLGATETITIGAGGATAGAAGGNSSFGSWMTAYGGGGGSAVVSNTSGGGGGGGCLAVGSNGSAGTGGVGGGPGGSAANTGNAGSGGAGGGSATAGGDSAYGGAGGAGTPANANNPATPGNSVWGGGGGGAGMTSTSGNSQPPGGTSVYGGAGGAGAKGSNAGAGNAPGGGGGGNSNAGTWGAGARGEIRVWVL